MGRKAFKPTDEQRKQVEQMAAVGITHEQIAAVIGISADTLTKYCGEELQVSATKANAQMGGALFRNGMKGNVAAQIFWLKTRAGWRENDVQREQTPITLILERGPTPKRLQLVEDEKKPGNGTDG